jgi:Tropinone reductase 1
MWNLTDKRALVTGGTKGIGRATVLEFLALGAQVLFTARNAGEVQAFQAELQAGGHQASGIRADVASGDDLQEVTDWLEQHWGALDVLVNNAGTNLRKPSTHYSPEEYRMVIDVDLLAPFEWSRRLLPWLRKGEGANVINVASVAGLLDVQTGSPYGMAKAGLIGQTRNLAAEWAGYNIRVNAVSPWFTQTPLTGPLLAQPDRLERVLGRTPLKRIAHAGEMASVIAFLAMDKASYITGQNIVVDGGMTASAF